MSAPARGRGRGGPAGGRGRFGDAPSRGRGLAQAQQIIRDAPTSISIRGSIDVDMTQIISLASNFGHVVGTSFVTRGDPFVEVTYATPVEAARAVQALDGIVPPGWNIKGTLHVALYTKPVDPTRARVYAAGGLNEAVATQAANLLQLLAAPHAAGGLPSGAGGPTAGPFGAPSELRTAPFPSGDGGRGRGRGAPQQQQFQPQYQAHNQQQQHGGSNYNAINAAAAGGDQPRRRNSPPRWSRPRIEKPIIDHRKNAAARGGGRGGGGGGAAPAGSGAASGGAPGGRGGRGGDGGRGGGRGRREDRQHETIEDAMKAMDAALANYHSS